MKIKEEKIKNYTIEIMKYIVIIMIIIINLYILSSIFNRTKSSSFTIPPSPQINTVELKNLKNIVNSKIIYNSTTKFPNIYVQNIF